MSLLAKIVARIRNVAAEIHDKIEDIHDQIHERRAERLAIKLDAMAAGTSHTNWRTSAQDLAFTIGEDGSKAGRKILWSDLGFTEPHKFTDEQNIRLHKALMDSIAHDLGYRLA